MAHLCLPLQVQIWHEVPLGDLGDVGVPSQGGDFCDYVVFDPQSGQESGGTRPPTRLRPQLR